MKSHLHSLTVAGSERFAAVYAVEQDDGTIVLETRPIDGLVVVDERPVPLVLEYGTMCPASNDSEYVGMIRAHESPYSAEYDGGEAWLPPTDHHRLFRPPVAGQGQATPPTKDTALESAEFQLMPAGRKNPDVQFLVMGTTQSGDVPLRLCRGYDEAEKLAESVSRTDVLKAAERLWETGEDEDEVLSTCVVVLIDGSPHESIECKWFDEDEDYVVIEDDGTEDGPEPGKPA